MRVAIIGPVYPYRGGIAHYTTLMARAFREAGHHTQVISFRRQYPKILYPGASDKDPSKNPLRTEAEYLLDPLFPWTWYQAARVIAAEKPELIVIQWWTTFWSIPFTLLSWCLKRWGLRVVYLIHNVLPHEQRLWDAWLARWALKQGWGFVIQTSKEKERLLTLVPGARVEICPHPVYSAFFVNRMSKSEARELLDLPHDIPVLLFFGIVRQYKGLKHLIEALGLLRQQGIKPCLVVAGEFWESKAAYLRQINKLGLTEQIRIQDRYIPDEELEGLFSACDVLIAPYTGGTQSGSAQMALGFGLPLIATEQIASSILESKRRDVQIVPPGDPEALAWAIYTLIRRLSDERDLPKPAADDWDQLVQALLRLADCAGSLSMD